MRILVTGASGFVGRTLCPALVHRGYEVLAGTRGPPPADARGGSWHSLAAQSEHDWGRLLGGCDAVVHLAGLAHRTGDRAMQNAAFYLEVNTDASVRLAARAARAGVAHFIFLSTARVNGEGGDVPSRETDAPNPSGAYAISKWRAEQGLAETAAATGMALTILRPPLVYGPGVKGNFLRLLRLVDHGVPLPFAAVSNHRSFIYAGNLADAIARVIASPQTGAGTFLLSDGDDISTPGLIRRIGAALGKRTRLFAVPTRLLGLAASVTGQARQMHQLTGSAPLDMQAIGTTLGWSPPFTMVDGLRATADWYRAAATR